MYKEERDNIKKYIAENPYCTWEDIFKNVNNHYLSAKYLAGSVLSWTTIDLKNNKNLHPEIYIARNHNN